jgi:sugar phosphate isomerase/epimerase
LERAAEEAARNGYQALEIRVLDGELIRDDLSAARRREVKATMARHGLKIAGLGLSTNFSSPDAATRQANQAQLERYLTLANDLETPMVRTFGGNLQAGATLDATIDWVAGSLNAVAPTAERMGVDVLLETHDAFCRGAEVARVLAQVPSPRIGAIWDVHHPFRMGESIEETWGRIGPRVKHVHIKDARLRPDGSWQLVLLGQGEVPCREVVQLLHREGYAGAIAAEWEKKWHPEIEPPEIALPQHAAVLRSWMQALS